MTRGIRAQLKSASKKEKMVTTRGGSDNRERIEELEASVVALKAHVVTHDQVRDIEAAQRELSDTLTP